jgi:hypothetical protein
VVSVILACVDVAPLPNVAVAPLVPSAITALSPGLEVARDDFARVRQASLRELAQRILAMRENLNSRPKGLQTVRQPK